MAEVIPANVPIEVFIARSERHVEKIPDPLVAILPHHSSWNDFGRNFFAKLYLRTAKGDWSTLDMRLMFHGRRWSEQVLLEMLDQFGGVFPIERILLPFVTLLTRIECYRHVIEVLGFEAGVSALRKMHDATVTRAEGTNQQLLELIDGEEFHIGALRDGGAYDALRRGSRYFTPKLPDPVEDAAADFVFGARLPSADNSYALRFRFKTGKLFRDRASILIGRNGVGKTQLLKSIVDGLHTNHEAGFLRPRFFPAFRPSRVLVFSSVPTDPFPRSIGAWHGLDYEYFPINVSGDNGTDALLAALVACKKSGHQPDFENGSKSRMEVIEDAIKPIGVWQDLYLPLRSRKSGDELPHVFQNGEQSFFPIWRHLNELNSIRLIQQIDWSRRAVVLGADAQPRQLSSGEYAMLRFAAQVSAAIEQGSLLLLDEPETHLHPNFVSDLMEILDNLLQSTKSIAIIATHSAYVVREAPRDRVHIVTLEKRRVQINTPRMQTFGATVDSISQFVFGDTSISHRYQKTLTEWADQTGRELGIDGVIDQYGEQLNPESLSFIARRLAEPPTAAPDAENSEVQ